MTGLVRLPARWQPLLALALLASLLVAAEHYVVHQAAFRLHPALLPAAVAFDLLVVLPGLFYWLGVRRGRLPASLLVAAVGVGLALSRWLLGAALPLLVWAGWAAQGLEALTLGYTALRLRRVVRAYRVARQQSPYFLENLQVALAPTLGGLAPLLATEVAVLRYAALGAWATPEVAAGEQAFSTYRQSGFGVLLATVAGLSVVEAGAAHLVLAHWHPTAAWVLTAASAYTLLWLLAHGLAVRCRPVLVSATHLTVRVGFVWWVRFPKNQLIDCKVITDSPPAAAGLLNVARPLLAAPNILLTLAGPQVARGVLGRARVVRRLALYVDEPAALVRALQ